MTTKTVFKAVDSDLRRAWSEYREEGNELVLDSAYRQAKQDIQSARLSEKAEQDLLDWFLL